MTTNAIRSGDNVAYETKVILTLLAERISQAQSIREAYQSVVRAASAEGLQLPTFDEMKAEIEQFRKDH